MTLKICRLEVKLEVVSDHMALALKTSVLEYKGVWRC